MLIVCFIIKLIGGNWFEIVCNNEHFVKICDYIDTHLFLNYCIAFPVYTIPAFFTLLACCIIVKPNLKQSITILAFIIVVWSSQFISPYVKLLIEIVMFMTLPFITRVEEVGLHDWKESLKKTWYLGVIGYLLTLLFQILSLVTRNIGIKFVEYNSLVSILMMIDYYIMVALYYLYVILKKKKEKENG